MQPKPGEAAGEPRIAILMGGQSAEREVSIATGRTVARNLVGRWQVKPVEIRADGAWVLHAGWLQGPREAEEPERWFHEPPLGLPEALAALRAAECGVVFNGLHGPMGEDGTMQGLFRVAALPLTGPDVIPAAVSMDKRLTKQVLLAAGLRTPRFFAIRASRVIDPAGEWRQTFRREAERVPLPWILKPARLGSSVGVGIFESLSLALEGAPGLVARWPPTARDEELLVEELVRGRELTCGVLEVDGAPRALPPVEIRPRGHEFFDFDAKYTPGASEEICPAPLAPEETAEVQRTAIRVHETLGLEPLSRTDMFLTPDGRIEVLEVNTLPGMTATSLIPLSAAKAGIPLPDLLDLLVGHAIRRFRRFAVNR
jgi:D-alanine-D-alanine ligase